MDRKLRVLLVSDLAPPVRGGLEIHVDALATELVRRGHAVRLATLTARPSLESADVQVRTIRSLSTRLPHEDIERPFHPPLPDPVARADLARAIEEFRPDVIHGHSWLSVSLPHRTKIPLVFTAHDYGQICQLRTLLHPDLRLCAGPGFVKCIRCARPSSNLPTTTLMTGGTAAGRRLMRPRQVIAVSGAVSQALAPYLRAPITVVPNFIGTPVVAEQLPAQIPEGNFVFFAGDPGPHKGARRLVELWASKSPPVLPLVLAITRDFLGPLPAGVYTAKLSRGQMTTAWGAAAIAVLPSIWSDPCPTVALEALRSGTPIVATRLGGITDLIREGLEGLLVGPNDTLGLREAIDLLIRDTDLRRAMAKAATKRAHNFTAEVVVPQIQDIYELAMSS